MTPQSAPSGIDLIAAERARQVAAEGSMWHVVCGYATWCGRPVAGFPHEQPARHVDPLQRCAATGCKSHWPALLRAVS